MRIRQLNEPVDGGFLSQSTVHSIGDTLMDCSPADRVTLLLAMQRLALNLAVAMSNAVQTAIQASAANENTVVNVSVEGDESDENLWMQMPSPWKLLHQSFREALEEARNKEANQRIL